MAEKDEISTNIEIEDINNLVAYFQKNTYRTRESNPTTEKILDICHELFKQDYRCMVIPNSGGEICNSYPGRLVLPLAEIGLDLPPGLLCANSLDLSGNSSLCSSVITQYSNPGQAVVPPAAAGSVSQAPQPAASGAASPLVLLSPDPTAEDEAPLFSAVLSGSSVPRSISCDGLSSQALGRRVSSGSTAGSNAGEGEKLKDLFLKAKLARCRERFPVPSLLYSGKFICRSSTLSGGAEMYGRSGIEYLFPSGSSKVDEEEDEELQILQTNSDWQLFDRVRSQDIKLLKTLNVGVIVDLMVEKKKVKWGVNVTSSEKVDKENRYSDFSILSLPYPGCEFFKDYRDRSYNADGLLFNWNQPFVDAQLVIPERTISSRVVPDWHNYRKWDLVRLTQNYLRLLLAYLHEGSSGVLIHCISGWDRTPLFISLLRISLWADGLVHSNLDTNQLLYLTIAYDWMLFGHDLQDRLSKFEEIFFFCFWFLKNIESDEFSAGRRRHLSCESISSERVSDGILLEADCLSSAGSSNSLNSSCSSSKSSHHTPPVFFKAGHHAEALENVENYNPHLTWPYGSLSDMNFDELSSPNLSQASSSSSAGRCSWGRSSFRESLEVTSKSREGRLSSGDSSNSLSGGSKCSDSREKRVSDVSPSDSRKADSRRHWENGSGASGGSAGYSADVSKGLLDHKVESDLPRTSTSPVAVPVPGGGALHSRTRTESVSSVGSWQIISGTGSLRGSTGSHNPGSSVNSRSSRSSLGIDMVDSSTTIREEARHLEPGTSIDSGHSIIVFNRTQRLRQVRETFHKVYDGTIGFRFPNGRQDSGITNLVSNFAHKVGIRPLSRITT